MGTTQVSLFFCLFVCLHALIFQQEHVQVLIYTLSFLALTSSTFDDPQKDIRNLTKVFFWGVRRNEKEEASKIKR
jgi:hypothetical protein